MSKHSTATLPFGIFVYLPVLTCLHIRFSVNRSPVKWDLNACPSCRNLVYLSPKDVRQTSHSLWQRARSSQQMVGGSHPGKTRSFHLQLPRMSGFHWSFPHPPPPTPSNWKQNDLSLTVPHFTHLSSLMSKPAIFMCQFVVLFSFYRHYHNTIYMKVPLGLFFDHCRPPLPPSTPPPSKLVHPSWTGNKVSIKISTAFE